MCNNCDNCTCNGSRFYHRVITATAGTSLELTTTNSDNINDKDPYYFQANARAISIAETANSLTEISIFFLPAI